MKYILITKRHYSVDMIPLGNFDAQTIMISYMRYYNANAPVVVEFTDSQNVSLFLLEFSHLIDTFEELNQEHMETYRFFDLDPKFRNT